MKNENKNAIPLAYGENDFYDKGLTKLEYAVIHIAAGIAAADATEPNYVANHAIAIAKQIFKQLEDDSTSAAPDTEL